MFTGLVGPVVVFFYWPESVCGNFYWPGAIGLPLASSPAVLALAAAASSANIKIHFDAKMPQFAIFGTRIIYVFYSISCHFCSYKPS